MPPMARRPARPTMEPIIADFWVAVRPAEDSWLVATATSEGVEVTSAPAVPVAREKPVEVVASCVDVVATSATELGRGVLVDCANGFPSPPTPLCDRCWGSEDAMGTTGDGDAVDSEAAVVVEEWSLPLWLFRPSGGVPICRSFARKFGMAG
jgi:hypothetical protein